MMIDFDGKFVLKALGKSFLWNIRPFFTTFILAIACVNASVRAGQLPLNPYSSGEYVTDFNGSAKNNSLGLGTLGTTSAGGEQGIGSLREHRSFLIFDTLQADSAIVAATIQIDVSSWTNTRGGQPNTSVPVDLMLGQPTSHTAAEIAASHSFYGDAGVLSIFNDLAGNSLGSIAVNMAPNLPGGSGSATMYSATLPFGFIAAFNQARNNGTRYVSISIAAAQYTSNYVQFGNGNLGVQLVVNSLSVVPEPYSVSSLIIGIGGISLARQRRRKHCA